ncbi:U3 small nucleolar ribonucleoprotein complex, subunit Mpp10 [Lineolata rhizophorae]|uniref:U3 small nucleolar ribonucleoprotein complex, subunit Mpp10 n=1 Tax=Lineolata rhizophorae TaxID=578093 RepID=A0A6A6PCI2_9PEZI|nr:U3 small nucleolar ribonucleoprotein complex, subunit Mpp10 [Lineolata rhizophorae]
MATVPFSPTASTSSQTLSIQSHLPPMDDRHAKPTSASSGSPPIAPPHPPQHELLSTLAASPYAFLRPSRALHADALSLAKRLLDPLASGVSEAQGARLQDWRRKRKRRGEDFAEGPVLRLKKVHVDGFDAEQVWQQARKVLDAAKREVAAGRDNDAGDGAEADGHTNSAGGEVTEIEKDRFDLTDSAQGSLGSAAEEDDPLGDSELEIEDGFLDEGEEDDDNFSDHSGEDADDLSNGGLADEGESSDAEEFIEDPHGLNDGFFSIDDFNKQTEFLEHQDNRGDDDGAASDEEEVDWNADPLAAGSRAIKLSNGRDEDASSADEDEDDGPTFGNADLNAPEGASNEETDDEAVGEGEMTGMGGLSNTNNITYADFFAPPARKSSKKKARKSSHPKKQNEDLSTGDDVERTMSAVHRDLFSDEDDADDNSSDSFLSDVDPDDPKARRSTHERRKAKLAQQIRKLEAANVAKRAWALAGEARAADRPLNSLLEEDLEFERAGKPVPTTTQETTEELEQLIKRRILARDFDEVVRRRPGAETVAPGTRRGAFELPDSKPSRGLAEEYEEEHLRRTDPAFVDASDERLRREHKEIAALWADVEAQLDALASWRFRPRPPRANLEVRVDAPAISMEDARPAAADGSGVAGGASLLAPQELYRPGEEREVGEVRTKGGLPLAREELSRDEKRRRRQREKARVRKAGGDVVAAGAGAGAGKGAGKGREKKQRDKKERNEVLGQLRKGGAQVIGKKGEIRDLEGKLAKNGQSQGRSGGAGFKL